MVPPTVRARIPFTVTLTCVLKAESTADASPREADRGVVDDEQARLLFEALRRRLRDPEPLNEIFGIDWQEDRPTFAHCAQCDSLSPVKKLLPVEQLSRDWASADAPPVGRCPNCGGFAQFVD